MTVPGKGKGKKQKTVSVVEFQWNALSENDENLVEIQKNNSQETSLSSFSGKGVPLARSVPLDRVHTNYATLSSSKIWNIAE